MGKDKGHQINLYLGSPLFKSLVKPTPYFGPDQVGLETIYIKFSPKMEYIMSKLNLKFNYYNENANVQHYTHRRN